MVEKKHLWKILVFDMLLIEFGPVGVFFITFYLSGFEAAALSLALGTAIALIVSRLVNKRLPLFALFSGSVTVISAYVTYRYSAPWVLIVKDSVYYFLFAGLLLISLWRGKPLLKAFFGHIFAITKQGWNTLEKRWAGFFLSAGVLNEVVRMYLTIEQWVLYKQVILIVFVVFGLYQFRVSTKHRLPEADRWGLRKKA